MARAAAADTPCPGDDGGRRVGGPDQVSMLDEVDAGRWGRGAATEEEEVEPRRQQWIHEGGGVRGVPRRRRRRIHDGSDGSKKADVRVQMGIYGSAFGSRRAAGSLC